MLGGWGPTFVGGYPGAQTLYPTKLVSNLLLLMHRGIYTVYYIYEILFIYMIYIYTYVLETIGVTLQSWKMFFSCVFFTILLDIS